MSAWTELATWMPPQDVITPTSLPASTGATSGTSAGVGAGAADNVGALPSWLLVALFVLVVLIIAAMFALSWWSLNAPRATLRKVLGLRWFRSNEERAEFVTPQLSVACTATVGAAATKTVRHACPTVLSQPDRPGSLSGRR